MTQSLPLVTIAIPTYNRAESFFPKALESALKQTYPNLEIIVGDNASSDNTEQIVKSMADSRVRYFKHPRNIGSNNNCNFCLQQAKGDFFLFLFDDDYIDQDMVEVCMSAIKGNTKVGVILTGAREVNEQGEVIIKCKNRATGESFEDFFLGWFAGRIPLFLCSTLYNTEGLREIGFCSKTNMYEDVVCTAKLMAKYGRVDVPDIKATFRRHSTNLGSLAPIHEWCEDSLFLLDWLCRLASSKQDILWKEGIRCFCIRHYGKARRVRTLNRRIRAYWTVYHSLRFSYSPISYLYRKNLERVKKRLLKWRNGGGRSEMQQG
jgi:glycosyltransferase involved in cell wall biosynthesis